MWNSGCLNGIYFFLDCPWYTAALKQKCSAMVFTGYFSHMSCIIWNTQCGQVYKVVNFIFIGGGSLSDGPWTTTLTVLHIHQQVLLVVPSKWSSTGTMPWKCSYRNDAVSLFKYSKVKCMKQLICGTFQEEYPHKGHEDGPEEGGSTGDCLNMWIWFSKNRKVSLFYTNQGSECLSIKHTKQAWDILKIMWLLLRWV